MANNSDRAYFLETIKTRPMTIAEIIQEFGCSSGTARNWVKHPEVEKVVGSWPTAYTRKDSLVPVSAGIKRPDTKPSGVIRYDIPEPPEEAKEKFFRQVLAKEGGNLNFVEEFVNADSQQDLKIIINKLKTALVVTEYYLSLMKKEGTP